MEMNRFVFFNFVILKDSASSMQSRNNNNDSHNNNTADGIHYIIYFRFLHEENYATKVQLPVI